MRACARAIAKQGAVNVPTSIVSKFRGFDLDTIIAVFRQQYQRHLRRTTSQHRRAEVGVMLCPPVGCAGASVVLTDR